MRYPRVTSVVGLAAALRTMPSGAFGTRHATLGYASPPPAVGALGGTGATAGGVHGYPSVDPAFPDN